MDKKKKVKTVKKTDKLKDLSEDEAINLYHFRCIMNFIMKVREGKFDKYFEDEDKKE